MKKLLYAIAVTLFMTIALGMAALAAPGITPTLLNDFETSAGNVPANTLVMPAGTYEMVCDLNVGQKGQVKLDLATLGLPSGIMAELFSNSACTNRLGSSAYLGTSSLQATLRAPIPAKGTYYLKFSRSKYGMDQPASFNVKAYCYSGEGKNLSNKVWAGTYAVNSNEVLYHKVVVKNTGYLKVEGYGEGYNGTKGSVYTTLYNSKKKAVSNMQGLSSSSGFTGYYGVKKGTYYIGVRYSGHYKLKYTFSAVKDKNISSTKKAAVINKGKTVKGLITAGESAKKADWYKFKVTSNKKLKLWLNSKATGTIRVQVFRTKDRLAVNGSLTTYNADSIARSTEGKMKKGTYYLKVTKAGNTTNGYYTLKWK